MIKNITKIFFYCFFCLIFYSPLSADDRQHPPFSFLDGVTYSKQATTIYACPSKRCEKVVDLYENCEFDYYQPTGNGDYGEWLRIRGFSCIANNSIIHSNDVDGYILEKHTAQQLGSFYFSLNDQRDYEFKLLLCTDGYCSVFDSKKENIKDKLLSDKCKIIVNYAVEVKKQTGWLFIDHENSQCKLKRSGNFVIAAIQIFKKK